MNSYFKTTLGPILAPTLASKDDPIFSGRFVISSKNLPQESTSSTKKPNAPSREVKPETGGYEIFARFVAIVLVGALPAFCINVAKTTVRTVGKNADSVVLSKAGRELRLSRNPEDNDLPGLVGRAVIRTVGRKVLRKHRPLAARAKEIQDRVHHLAEIRAAWAAQIPSDGQ
jgi:hypothetical protein